MMRIPTSFIVLLAVSLLSTGCSGGDSPSTGDAGDDAAQECHYDCFAELTCEDGEVFYQPGGEIRCDEGGAEACDRGDKVGECQEGCQDAVEVTAGADGQNWEQMCEENRPRAAGEACTSDQDCQPTEQYVDEATGDLVSKELVCDQETGACTAPDTRAYLAFCNASASEIDVGTGYLASDGDVAIPGCTASDYCILDKSPAETCQYCTMECQEHADCPSGSWCVFTQNLGTLDDDRVQLCQPLGWDNAQAAIECVPNP